MSSPFRRGVRGGPHVMKIAIDIQSLYDPHPSGVGHYVLEVLKAIEPDPGIELVLFSRGQRMVQLDPAITSKPNVRHIHRRIPNKLINPLLSLGIVSLEQLLGEHVDVVWYPNTGYLPRTRAKTVLTVHDLAWFLMPETYNWVHHIRYSLTRARTWIKQATHVVAVSNATKQDVVTQFDRSPEDVTAIHHGLDHKSFSPKVQPTDKTRLQQLGIRHPYLVCIATREPRKNLAGLVEAFNALRSHGHQIDLVLAGGRGWKRKALDNAIEHSAYKQHIHVLGFVADEDRPVLLRGAKALVLPSRYEGFGMQVAEALACGTPVVTSRNSSLPEAGGTSVFTVRAMHQSELVQILNQALRDSNLQPARTQRGIEHARQFTWQECAQQTLDVLKKSL